jgi:Rne/Rng family ribonuclease
VRYKPFGHGVVGAKSLPKTLVDSVKQYLSPMLSSGGCVVRSSLKSLKTFDLVGEELQSLQALRSVFENSKHGYKAPKPAFKMLLNHTNFESIEVGSWEVYEELTGFLKSFRPDLHSMARFVPSLEGNSLRQESLDALEELMDPTIALPNGGHGIIQETLACTAIDLNTSGTYLDSPSGTIAQELARQISLRALGGLTVIDWPTRNTAEKNKIQQEMINVFSKTDTHILGWTRGGLLEILSPRRGPSLNAILKDLQAKSC